ncbi:MAG: DUF5808 domain-containing protein [Thermoanaerobaculia bacterium]
MSAEPVMTLWLSASALLWVLALGGIFLLLPRWTRSGLAFAVSVRPGFLATPRGREILKRYRRGVLIATLLTGAGWVAVVELAPHLIGGAHLLLLPELAAFTAVYLRARRASLPHAVVHAAPPPAVPGRIPLPGGWLGQTAPFALLAGASAWILSRMGSLPERIPIHYGTDLEADRWVAPTWPHLLGLPLVGVATCGAILLMSWAMSRSTRAATDARQGEMLRLTLRILLGSSLMVAGLFGGVSLLALRGAEQLDPLVLVAIILVPEAAGLVLLIWVLLRFSRLRSSSQVAVGDRTDDRFWKAGLVYFNPDDPTLFVEKRFGIGYTMNMARPASWWLLGALVLFPLLVVLLLELLG